MVMPQTLCLLVFPKGFNACLPTELDVFVDAASNAHGHDGIVPGADEHQGETQAHTQKRQSPE